jgi:hypothetical protein
MMIMRLGVIKPLETRKFIVVSRQYLGNSEAEVIELWRNVMVGRLGMIVQQQEAHGCLAPLQTIAFYAPHSS